MPNKMSDLDKINFNNNQDASIENLFEGGPSLEDRLRGEIEVLEEENEKLKAELTAANDCLDMLLGKRDEEIDDNKERISSLEKEVKEMRIKATPTSKDDGKMGFEL